MFSLNEKTQLTTTYQKSLSLILFVGMLLFFTGFFWQAKYSRLHTVYYILTVLPSLLLIPVFLKEQLHKNKLFILIILFFIYSLLSVFWADNYDVAFHLKFLRRVVVSAVLFYAVYHIVLNYPFSEKMIYILVMVSGTVLALYSILINFSSDTTGRLKLWGGLNDPISSATVYGALFLLAARAYLLEKNKYRLLLYFSLCLLFLVEILLTKSRGPQLALLLSTPLLFLIIKPLDYKRVFYPLLSVVAACAVLAFSTDVFETVFSRGFSVSQRDVIWNDSINLSLEEPWFGYGIGTVFQFFMPALGETVSHSHNFLLSTWLYSGVIGVVLILAIIYQALKISFASKKEYFAIFGVIMVFGIFCLLTNGSYPISRANERWFVFWIPLAFIVAHSARRLK